MAESEEHGGAGPLRGSVPRYKIAVITWLAIYPALTVTIALLSPVLAPLPLFLRTLILTVVLVPIMVYVLVPTVQRLFAGWLSSDVSPNRSGR
jgi:uncharacterized protein